MPDNTAEPILERIALSLADALAAVKSPAYRCNLRRILRPDRDFVPRGLEHLDVVFTLLSDERHPGAENTGTVARLATFRAFVNVVKSELDPTPVDTALARLLADVNKAVRVDRQRRGLAIDTLWGDAALLDGDAAPLTGVAVDLLVHYETDEDDPNSL